MIVNIPISLGELVDKISILQIKLVSITDPAKLENINAELSVLHAVLDSTGIKADLEDLYLKLYNINHTMWHLEDRIRECESASQFGEVFIDAARTIHTSNIIRSNIKKEINIKFGSTIIEEKSYSHTQ